MNRGFYRGAVAGVVLVLVLVLRELVVWGPGRPRLLPGVWNATSATLLAVVVIAITAYLLRMRGDALGLDESGVVVAPGTEHERRVAWAHVRGVRRPWYASRTTFVDPHGERLFAVADELGDHGECLGAVLDAAPVERAAIPSRWALRGVPLPWVMIPVIVAAGFSTMADPQAALLTRLLWFPVALVVVVWASQVPIAVELAPDGVTLRTLLRREHFAWADLQHCGFDLTRAEFVHVVSAKLWTRRGLRAFVPLGAPAFAIVAAVRDVLKRD